MLAEEYWSRITEDPRISEDFRRLAAEARARLQTVPSRAAPVAVP